MCIPSLPHTSPQHPWLCVLEAVSSSLRHSSWLCHTDGSWDTRMGLGQGHLHHLLPGPEASQISQLP